VTRFVVDCGVVLQLASDRIEVAAEHELLAPTSHRSSVTPRGRQLTLREAATFALGETPAHAST
jgi:hypothetical protein